MVILQFKRLYRVCKKYGALIELCGIKPLDLQNIRMMKSKWVNPADNTDCSQEDGSRFESHRCRSGNLIWVINQVTVLYQKEKD